MGTSPNEPLRPPASIFRRWQPTRHTLPSCRASGEPANRPSQRAEVYRIPYDGPDELPTKDMVGSKAHNLAWGISVCGGLQRLRKVVEQVKRARIFHVGDEPAAQQARCSSA